MSIASQKNENISIIYKVFGEGTEIMSKWNENDQIDVIGPLGNYWTPYYPSAQLRSNINELSNYLISYMQGGLFNYNTNNGLKDFVNLHRKAPEQYRRATFL